MKYRLLLLLLIATVISFGQNKKQSIGFKENKGQIIDQKGKPNSAVKYLLNTGGLNVQLKENGFSYDIYETKKHPIRSRLQEKKTFNFSEDKKQKFPDHSLEYIFHRIDIDFVNSNPNVELITEEKSLDYDNYYNIPNKPEGVLMVYQYKQITYKNIYPNIDVVFSIPKDTLKPVEYNFVVHPKGKISDIQLKFSGVQTELVDKKIRMTVRFGKMDETLPASWTEDGESKKEIAVGYNKIKKNVYGFTSSDLVSNKTVIIDPVPVRLWGTYYGGNGRDYSFDITTNNNNDVFITGNTWSSTNIATIGTHQSNLTGSSNLFFAKFDTDGNRVWGTYFYYDNGLFNSHPAKIKSDSNNNLYFAAAEQYSTDIATVGTFQFTKNNYSDVILVKLNNFGVREWATYYGGNGDEALLSLCLDNSNNIYIAGQTSSTDIMSSPGSHQVNNSNNSNDGFIAKFDPSGNRIWGTFYGGMGADAFFNISISNDGFLYASGTQNSSNNIASTGAYQEFSNGNSGGMIIKFTLDGQRIWGTYFIDDSYVYNAKLQGDNLYIMGRTWNKTSISSPNAFYENFQIIQTGTGGSQLPSSDNSFVISFNLQTKTKNWGTYFIEQIRGIDVNKNGETYFSGDTNLNSGITTVDGYMPSKGFGMKIYLIKLNNLGQRIWGSYYGGNQGEQIGYVHIDNQQSVYLTGITSSSTGIASSNAHQLNLDSNSDSFLAKFQDCLSNPLASSNSPICIGKTLELKASGGTTYAWTGPNGFTSTDQNPIIPNATALNGGQYNCNITGTGGCDGVATVEVIIDDTIAPIPNLTTLPTITGNCHTLITTIPTATDACAGTITATTNNPLSYSLPGTYTVVWDYDDGNNNISHQNQTVTISNQPLPTATSSQTFCIQQNATLNDIAITGQNIKWYNQLTDRNLLLNTALLQSGHTYYASQTINGCESERIPVLVNIQNTPAPTGDANQSFCSSQNPTLNNIVVVGTTIKWYDNPTLGNLLTDATPLVDGETYYATQNENNCESYNRLAVTVSLISSLSASDYSELSCDDGNDSREIVNLSDYNFKLIAPSSTYNFTYYTSSLGAENESIVDQISNFSNYNLVLGDNKIYVRINSNTPCHAIAELKLTLVSKPVISIPDVVPICENNTVIIDAGSGFDSYLWSTGATTASIIVSNPGNFNVTVTNNYSTISCSSSKTFTVKNSTIATINTIETKDWTDTENMITVYVTGAGDFEYSIDGIHFQDSHQFLNVHSGEYTVHVRDKNGCGTATEEVYLLMYPKFFTPNGDGHNDTWNIKFSDLETSMTIKIFDRYGKLLKELTQNNSWDGTFNSQELAASDYWFAVTRSNGTEYKGHFSLKR